MKNVDELEKEMILFSNTFGTMVSKSRTLMDEQLRYGLYETKNYALYQYINFLKGL
jgi:hypothetical protein